jgi:hypothetical protein
MAEIVNLRRARKAKARDEKEKAADANRVLHGTPKNMRDLAKAQRAKDDRNVDGHRLKKDEAG